MQQARIPVAREGVPFIGLAALATLICAVLDYDLLALIGLTLTFFITWFFRDPDRIPPQAADAIVSPADGKVILIEKVFDERFVQEHVYKISIFMNIFNVHVNRIPHPGTVESIRYSAGRFHSANTEQGALYNEHCAVTIRTARHQLYGVVQVAGLIARRIVCWLDQGDEVKAAQRFGLIRFGSRVDLYLPLQTQVEVRLGQQVRAGETLIGYLH